MEEITGTAASPAMEKIVNMQEKEVPPGQDVEKLAADLYISDLIFDSRMGGRRIRMLLEHGVIKNLRDLFSLSFHQIARDKRYILSSQEWSDIRCCLSDDSKKEQARRKAQASQILGIRSVNRDDGDYPVNLRKLEGMPLVLYWMGELSILGSSKMPAAAVVGSRQPTIYGVTVTKEITSALVRCGVCIISGLARGIDTVAHETALGEKGKTAAVLAGGLDQVYPPENKELFEQIQKTGVVLSEMPPGQKALRQYFPARNRILSGLSDVVAIMEAGEFSGTLHTASFAAAQGRDVFVVPGTIYALQSRGNLKLIQDGADLLLSAEDILARLAGLTFFREMDEIRHEQERKRMESIRRENPGILTHEECIRVILLQLSLGERTMDELIASTGFSYDNTVALLSELEISGRIVSQGQRYALTFPCL